MTNPRKYLLVLVGAICALALSGCAQLKLQLDPNPQPTPSETETPVPTAPLPTRNASTLVPTITPTRCTDSYYFIDDLTIPDGTVLARGAPFTKKWELRNNSSCNWNEKYKLRFISGEAFGSPAVAAVPNARVGENVVLALDLIAPEEAGMYEGRWKLFADNNLSFGTVLTVQIYVY